MSMKNVLDNRIGIHMYHLNRIVTFYISSKVDPTTGLIDYDALAASAALFKPRLIVAGVSCYSRHLDYARFRQIADTNGDIYFEI